MPRQERRKSDLDLILIKRISIGSLVAFCISFSGGIWWAATITAKVDFANITISSFQTQLKESSDDRYRGADAKRDLAIVNGRIDDNKKVMDEFMKNIPPRWFIDQVNEIGNRVAVLEGKQRGSK